MTLYDSINSTSLHVPSSTLTNTLWYTYHTWQLNVPFSWCPLKWSHENQGNCKTHLQSSYDVSDPLYKPSWAVENPETNRTCVEINFPRVPSASSTALYVTLTVREEPPLDTITPDLWDFSSPALQICLVWFKFLPQQMIMEFVFLDRLCTLWYKHLI